MLSLVVQPSENVPGYFCTPYWAIKFNYLIDYSLYYLFCRKLGTYGQSISIHIFFSQAIELKVGRAPNHNVVARMLV